MPDYVIDRVESLAEGEDQPIMTNAPIFEWDSGVPVIDEDGTGEEDHDANELDNDNIVYDDGTDEDEPSDKDEQINPDDDPEYKDLDEESKGEQNEDKENDLNETDDDIEIDTDRLEVDATQSDEQQLETNEYGRSSLEDVPNEDSEDSEQRSADTEDSSDEERNNVEQSPEPRSDGRPRRLSKATTRQSYDPKFGGKSYRTQFIGISNHKEKQWSSECYKIAVDVMFTQMSAGKGIKQFGERTIAAMFKEYNQLNDLTVFGRVTPDTLSQEHKDNALQAINLIKEKRNGIIKGRTIADGRPQRSYIPREDATSPTMLTTGLMASLIIDAYERRAVAIFDVPGAYLHADMPEDKFVLLKLEGVFVDIMSRILARRMENGKKVLYLRILKALYGCIESALLWYKLYVKVLKGMGYEINPYDRCIANKMIDGKQCTIAWYVDDNKASHDSEDILIDLIADIEKHFGKLVVSRGKEHTFLGMDLKFKDNSKVHVGMTGYIEEAIVLFGEDVSEHVKNMVTKKLFVVDENSKPLSTDKAEIFHSVVAKLLWVEKRSRPDIELVILFLCT